MKKTSVLLALLTFCISAYGQMMSQDEAMQHIKLGNTLREARQFEKAELYLKGALQALKDKNPYWEATAYENLGLLFRDQHRSVLAIKYLTDAFNKYKKLNMRTSAKAVKTLLDGVEGREQFYAGIEVGAKGVKGSVIGVYLNMEGEYHFKIHYDSAINPNIVQMTPEVMKAAAEAVNNLHADINSKYKIDKERFFLVGSSGVYQEAINHDKVKELRDTFRKYLKTDDKEVNFITPEQEAYYVITGSTLPKYRAISSTIDIGSGNTKGGFLVGDSFEKLRPISFDFGTRTFSDMIDQQIKELMVGYDSAARYLAKNHIRPQIDDNFKKEEGLKTRSIVHLVGGITWAMVSYMYPHHSDKLFVPVSPAVVKKFRYEIMENYSIITRPNIDAIADDDIRNRASINIAKASKQFTREELIAGSIILDEVCTEFNKRGPAKKFIYARLGYVGWISGYILESVKNEYALLDDL